MSNDTIANMIVCIRNANLTKVKTVRFPATNSTRSIAKILEEEGFIEHWREIPQASQSIISMTLKYQGRERTPYITTLRRISKPGLRVYSNHKEIPKVLGGLGIVILSTSQGIMTDRQAREKQLGGEVLCYVW
uniref:Small ribosomal subunit protein uS8c n=1 Tax=Streptosarcina moshanensis TaxID=3096259 RepID=A0AAU7LJR3_9VIRI|nr:ribosomal protein S8 [Streptosarcina arenaria]YP_010933516.1 ribosomal protein S8 [Streptosarcina costaricana]WKT08861.1 ribosomal protein S8 [Streptosarcina arenaria]WKT08962.1 ribosomal protein S8 [Streptosarcina costaricana]